MSGRCVSRVLESDLGPDLKFTAVVYASFADDDGRQIRPSVGLVAYLRGLQVRQIQYHVKELQRMEILDVVRPATQWSPTHYRMALDKLPTRALYRPPERQQDLVESVDESPGVHSAAPQSGVQSSVPGVQPTAPDPSVRSVSTHTYDARARGAAESGVQPAAPLTPTFDLPLVVSVRDADHAAHAWCGRICVPKFLHKQLKRALGGSVTKRAARMRAFYAETLDARPASQPIGDEPVKFWRKAFAARFSTAAHDRPAHRGRSRATFGAGNIACPHEPMCRTIGDCSTRILEEGRAEQERKSG